MEKVKWGILGTAKIGIEKVIPAMQKGRYSESTAIASRALKEAPYRDENDTFWKMSLQTLDYR